MDTEQLVSVQVRDFTPEEVEAAERKMVKRAGPVVARMRERTAESWGLIRAELNELAGGQASAGCTVMAHHALRAHTALELQSLLAEVSAGEDAEGSDRAFRSLAGLSVVATDLLRKAYAQAREEGAAKAKAQSGGPVGELMGRLGVTPTQGESSETGPGFDGGGGSTLGPPPPNSKPSRKKTP
jgi:hypothetical protein